MIMVIYKAIFGIAYVVQIPFFCVLETHLLQQFADHFPNGKPMGFPHLQCEGPNNYGLWCL